MASLAEKVERAGERYAELKARLEAEVVRWQWSTFDVHSLEPFYFERHRFGRGRILDAPPEEPESGNVESGFDAAGRVVVERGYTSVPGRFYETFYEFGDGEVDKYHYDYDPGKALIHLARFRFNGERLVELEHRYRGRGRRHERFEWEGQRLERVVVDHDENSHVDEFSYDSAGELTCIEWLYANGQRSKTFERVTETLPSLFEKLEAHLLEAIPRTLSALKPVEPIYAIALWLDMEAYEHVLPPGLAVGYESERGAFLERHGPERAKDYLYNPAEWRSFDTSELEYRAADAELLVLAAAANQLIWQNDQFDRAREHVDELARKLNRVDWAARLAVTDDCVVFPIDMACGDAIEEIERVAPAGKAALLRARGLI